MIAKTVDKIIKAMPKDREFKAMDITQAVFPNLERIDTEGRYYNRGVATVARLLRQINGVVEVDHGIFYAHKEYF